MACGLPANAQSTVANSSQSKPESDNPVTTGELEELIDTLADDARRKEFVDNLQTLVEAQKKQETTDADFTELTASDLLSRIQGQYTEFRESITHADPLALLEKSLFSLAALIAALALYKLLQHLLMAISRRISKEETAEDQVISSGMQTILKLVALFVFLFLLGQIWAEGPLTWLNNLLGEGAARTTISIVAVFVLALFAWHAADTAVELLIRERASSRLSGRQASRVESLIPLIKGVVRITLGILTALLILSELGLNIAPMLAGAGLLGVAIGFGAQSLVKDFLVGISILIEDSATVGDIVDIDGHIGKVTKLDLRVVRLRALDGALFTIPYSEVSIIKNLTKDFSYHLFKLGVAYGEDLNSVLQIIQDVAEELKNDDNYSDSILDKAEIFGLDEFGDSALIIMGRIKTQAGKQWEIGRAFNQLIKDRFDSEGIEIPFPHRTLYFGDNTENAPPPVTFSPKR